MSALNKRMNYENQYEDMTNYYTNPSESTTHLQITRSHAYEERGQIIEYAKNLETLKSKLSYNNDSSSSKAYRNGPKKLYNKFGFS